MIPTLFGIMLINFALTQFVPGGPVEQIIARLEGSGDVFQNISGGGDVEVQQQSSGNERYLGARGLPPEFNLETSDRLGLQIVRTLVSAELDGSLSMRPCTDGGTDVLLRVPIGRRGRTH